MRLGPAVLWISASSDPEKAPYLTARLYGTGLWVCSCPAGCRGQECRHIRERRAEVANAGAPGGAKSAGVGSN